MPNSTGLMAHTNGSCPKNIPQSSPNNVQLANKSLGGHIMMPNNMQSQLPRNIIVAPPTRFQIYPSGFKTMHGLPIPNNSPTNSIPQINKQHSTQSISPNLSQLQRPTFNIQKHTIPVRFQKIAPQTSPITLTDTHPRPTQAPPILPKPQSRPTSSVLIDKQPPELHQQNKSPATSLAQKRKSDDTNVNNTEANQPNKTNSLSTIAENSLDWGQNIAKNLTSQVNGAFKQTTGITIKKEKIDIIDTQQTQQQSDTPTISTTEIVLSKEIQPEAQKDTSNASIRDSVDSSTQSQSNTKSTNRHKKDGTRTQSAESQLTISTQDKGMDNEFNEIDNELLSIQNITTEGLVLNENDIPSEICIICRTRGEILTCNFCPRSYHHGCHVPTINNKTE
jgi:hypothetical protein